MVPSSKWWACFLVLGTPFFVDAKRNHLRKSDDPSEVKEARSLQGAKTILWTEECKALIGVGQTPGLLNQEMNETYFMACETEDNGRSHNVEGACKSWIDNRVFKGQLYSNKTILDLPETYLDETTDHLELTQFPPGLTNAETVMANATPAVGTRTVLAVIVRLEDAIPTITEPDLQDSLFGTAGDDRTLKGVYAGCSRNQLNIVPTTDRDGSSSSISGGTVTLQVPKPVTAGENIIRNAVTDALNAQFQVSSPAQLADHIMYCLPEGAMMLSAWGFVNNWLSLYTDVYCTHATIQSHNVAHNLNLGDSGKFTPYDDYTGTMGVYTDITTEPKTCFNAAKLFQLGWYNSNTEIMSLLKSSPPQVVTVQGFLKDANTGIKLVKFDRRSPYDFYLNFNWASGANAETVEGPNTVTISATGRHGQSYYESNLVAKMDAGDRFVQRGYYYGPCNLMVEVISIDVIDGNAAIYFESCFDTVEGAEAAAAAIEKANKIAAYQAAVAANAAKEAEVQAKQASGMPIAPFSYMPIPPSPPNPPITVAPVAPTPAPTPRPTEFPTLTCLEPGMLCFAVDDCCDNGEGECVEESFNGGTTYMLKCFAQGYANATDISDAELAESQYLYGESLLGIYGGNCNEDGICTDGEHCLNCPVDCAGSLVGLPEERFCCHGDVVSDIPFGVRGDDARCTCDRSASRDINGCNGYVSGHGTLQLTEKAYLKQRNCFCDSQDGICLDTCNSLDPASLPKASFEFSAKHFVPGRVDGFTNFDIIGHNFHFRTSEFGLYDGLEAICTDATYEYGSGVVSRWSGIGRIAWSTDQRRLQQDYNWEDGYRFFIAAQDNGDPGYLDTFRVRIMDKSNDAVLFDSNVDHGHIFDIDPFCNSTWDECNGDPAIPHFDGTVLGGENEADNGNINVHCTGGPANAPCDAVIPFIVPPTESPTAAPVPPPISRQWVSEVYDSEDFTSGYGKWEDGGTYSYRTDDAVRLKKKGNGAYITMDLPLDDIKTMGPTTLVKVTYSYWTENTEGNDKFSLKYSRETDRGELVFHEIATHEHGIDFGGDTGKGTSRGNKITEEIIFSFPHFQCEFLKLRFENTMSSSQDYTFIDGIKVEFSVPPVPRDSSCVYEKVDFSALTAGEYVSDLSQYYSGGITVTAVSQKKGHTPDQNGNHQTSGGAARVFDTLHPTGKDGQPLCSNDDGDEDLGSPNEYCPGQGPGIGIGGRPSLPDGTDNEYANCDPIGNVLVIQESDKNCPDDSAKGGRIIFDFDYHVNFRLVKFLDVDDNPNTPELTLTYEDDENTKKYVAKAAWSGDNGVVIERPNIDRVTQASIRFYGSGSIAELGYEVCPGDTPAPTTPYPTIAPSKTPTEAPVFVGKACESKQLNVCVAIDLSGSVCSPPSKTQLCTNCWDACYDSENFSKQTCCSNYHAEQEFSKRFINGANGFIGEGHEFSVVTFSTEAIPRRGLSPAATAIAAVDDIAYSGGWTNTGGGIQACHDSLTNSDAVNVIVLLTDGTPTRGSPNRGNGGYQEHKDYATGKANAAKNDGITIIPVVINTKSSNFSYLKTLGSDPNAMLEVNDFSALDTTLTELLQTLDAACA